MTTPDKSSETVTLNRRTISFVLEYLREEMETLGALASAVVQSVAVHDTKDPKDNDNIQAFRLAEVLEERLGCTRFEKSIRDILEGSK